MQEELAGIKGNALDWVKDRLRHLRVVTVSLEDNKLVCLSCGYIEEVKPTYQQLLAENEKLKNDLEFFKRIWFESAQID